MSLPANNKPQGQPSIRSFFAPKNPSYAAPPSSSRTTTTTTTTTTTNNPTTSPPPPSVTHSHQRTSPPPAARPQASALSQRPTDLHPQASIQPIQPEHIPALRRITSLILPINYPDSFYAQLSNPETSGAFSRVILWADPANSTPKVIGGLVCRPEPFPLRKPSGQLVSGLYIQSLVLLSPYRALGLAAACLEDVVASVVASSSTFKCETIWAHVWTQNDEGLGWYQRRGFGTAGEIKDYYFKLQPGDAYVVERPIVIDRQPSAATGMSYGSDTTTTNIQHSTTAMAANLPMYSLPPNGIPKAKSSVPPPPSLNGTARPAPPSQVGSASSLAPPPPSSVTSLSQKRGDRPPLAQTGTSFQNLRPETEWNDLPADMQVPVGGAANGGSRSGASSRSSSSVAASRKKRDRSYPAAAFGGN